ncbi:MAG: hypothetical protein B9S33_21575, partial [Pedosphaera sp. Tous-C6FEB]
MNYFRPGLLASLALTTACLAADPKVAAKKPATPPTPWSFQPLKESPLPKVRNAKWPQTRLDHFLLAKQEQAGLKPAAPADPRTLIRRLHFDLTGLPPTPEEVEAFVKECGVRSAEFGMARGRGTTDSAFRIPHSALASAVERLLASPHYGERYARYWLDLARYVDETASWLEKTSGAHLYRDWVIKAFNDDLPYDQFVMRQIAADQLIQATESKTPASAADARPEPTPTSQPSTFNSQPS